MSFRPIALASLACLALAACNAQPRDLDVSYSSMKSGPSRLSAAAFEPQTARVRTGCLKPGVIAILGKVRDHYGVEPVVTSGCRGHGRGRGRHSLHTTGEAADIKVPGFSKHAVHKYLRGLPEVGGTGLYGWNDVVHFDIGSKRVWNATKGRFRFSMLAQ